MCCWNFHNFLCHWSRVPICSSADQRVPQPLERRSQHPFLRSLVTGMGFSTVHLIASYLIGCLTPASFCSYYLVNISGIPGYGYHTVLGLGEPTQKLQFLLDTGSSNLAVATDKVSTVQRWFVANESKTLVCSNLKQTVRYQQGTWSGKLCTEQLTLFTTSLVSPRLNANLSLRSQISLIDLSNNFFPSNNTLSVWEGILGLGFAKLFVKPISDSWVTKILSPFKWTRTWTKSFLEQYRGHSLFDDLVLQLGLPNLFSLHLCGLTQNAGQSNVATGVWGLGTTIVNKSAASNGPIFFTPIRQAWFYEVVLTDLRINNHSVVDDCKELNFDKTVLDTGTTNIELPQRVFTSVVNHIKRHFYHQSSLRKIYPSSFTKFWRTESLLCESAASGHVGGKTGLPYILFPTMEFHFEENPANEKPETSFILSLSPQQYIRYVGRTSKRGQLRDCFAFGIQPSRVGTTLGLVFLEGFFTIFDRGSLQIGFSDSACNRYSNLSTVAVSQVLGIQRRHALTGPTASVACAFHRPVLSSLVGSANWTCFLAILCSIVQVFTTVLVRYISRK
ncbi:unnamed protein product [Dicrocoelium dendriticum]|nr:unnamed protein product [Dicrocoelium dendriticum]